MMDYVLLIFSVALLTVYFVQSKIYQNKAGSNMEAALLFNMLCGAFTAVLFYALNAFSYEINVYSGICAALVAGFGVLYTLIGFKILESGKMAYYTFSVMTGGMIVPYIFGIFYLNESVSALKVFGLLLIILSAFLIYAENNGTEVKTILYCAAVFLLNGFISVISKLHQISLEAVSANGFVLLTGLFKALGCFFVLLPALLKRERIESKKINMAWVAVFSAGAALSSGISYLLQLVSAKNLPASVLYPIVTGGSIVLSVLAAFWCFKERMNKKAWLGLGLCFLGTCMFL